MQKPENVSLVGETVFEEMSPFKFCRHYTIKFTFLSVECFFIKAVRGAENRTMDKEEVTNVAY